MDALMPALRLLPGHGRTPVLAMTANAYTEDRKRCLEAGMTDFIAKPFVPETVFELILKAFSTTRCKRLGKSP